MAAYFVETLWMVSVYLADPFGFDSCDFPIDYEWYCSEKVMEQQVCLRNCLDTFLA